MYKAARIYGAFGIQRDPTFFDRSAQKRTLRYFVDDIETPDRYSILVNPADTEGRRSTIGPRRMIQRWPLSGVSAAGDAPWYGAGHDATRTRSDEHVGRDLVSVVIPTFNAGGFFQTALMSLRHQSYANWEALVVDDASTDGSDEIARAWARKDPRIQALRLPRNGGPAAARNVAIQAARGRFIAFLDADDQWLPAKLERQLRFMAVHNAALSYTAYRKIDEAGNLISDTIPIPERVSYRSMLSTNSIACLTAIYDTRILGKVFMPDIAKRQDLALWLQILKSGHLAVGLNEPLALYRVRTASVSAHKFEAARYQWKVYREVERISLPASLYHFCFYAYRGYRKWRL